MLLSLQGLSIGDAFGGKIMNEWSSMQDVITNRQAPPGPWPYSDDTEMALSIVEVLTCLGGIDPDMLASAFARRYDPERGYGGSLQQLFEELREGENWRKAASTLFGGTGSYAVGAAKRVAPLGAFFADDLEVLIDNAELSAEVTHQHKEGIAGAVAVALAAAFAWWHRTDTATESGEILSQIADHLPASEIRNALRTAAALPPTRTAIDAAATLGSGHDVSAQDTVPFALWCAFHNLHNYEEALWATASGLGDLDSTCAIVGGIVALSAPEDTIPSSWREAREPLPEGF
jgi:ADP-ribosylglycohydrolase